MRVNKSIKRIQRTHMLALFLIIIFQILSLYFVNLFLTFFSTEMEQHFFSTFKLVVFAILGGVFVISDSYFLYKKIIKLRPLMCKVPIKCKIEDFLLFSYIDDGRKKYEIYPIIKSMQDDKLYLSYGANALSKFNTRTFYKNNSLLDFVVYTRDRKPLNIGDTVYMYSLKILDVTVDIDETKNKVKINNKTIPFNHINESLKISIFKNMIFFQGIVDTQ